MLKLVAIAEDDGETFEMPLLDEKDKPTKVFWGLLAAEVALDLYLGYAAFRFLQARAERKAAKAEQLAEAQAKADKLKGKVIELAVKCGSQGRLYGSVTTEAAAEALAKQHGVTVDKRKVDLGDPIREVGDREISIRLHPKVSTTMILRVSPLEK